ncbi:nucleotidylyl transferase [Phanerochaete sordida]|uniref:Nucleotidylyl transferase n=1 Tax=Phanerochaete sordida TaxID=48140 RepID=A0A9P3L7Y9_9APHY|nr:nucleotidylyl transferase [Phanerochaete sordida]
MSAHLEGLIHRVKQGLSAVELVHVPHDRWPLPAHAAQPAPQPEPLHIAVLDSSFNPPTLAHLALALVPASVRAPPTDVSGAPRALPALGARLLLLSVRNADKSLKAHDATYAQRLAMMVRLAQDVAAPRAQQVLADAQPGTHAAQSALDDPNVAVAIIDEPTFVGKSQVLHEWLQTRLAALGSGQAAQHAPQEQPRGSLSPPVPKPELDFLVGIDTLERIIAARYYGDSEDSMRQSLRQFLSAEGDGSRLVCARRITPGSAESPEDRERRVAKASCKYIEPERVTMIDIGEVVESYSSSEVREKISQLDTAWTRMVPPSIADYIRSEHLYLPSNEQH